MLETLAAFDGMRQGVIPAAAGDGDIDPDARVLLMSVGASQPIRNALKLSAAFGGTNAALVLSLAPTSSGRRPQRRVFVREIACVQQTTLSALCSATNIARDRLARLDEVCRLGMAAVAQLAQRVGHEALVGAGIVAGHAYATIDTNEIFDARRRALGATRVDPRVFPATTPNAVAGECAIAFKLTGLAFAVGAGLDGGVEALRVATDLVAAGDADRIVVLAVDDAGPVAHELWRAGSDATRPFAKGAAAVLIGADECGAMREVRLSDAPNNDCGPIGHLGLLKWLAT